MAKSLRKPTWLNSTACPIASGKVTVNSGVRIYNYLSPIITRSRLPNPVESGPFLDVSFTIPMPATWSLFRLGQENLCEARHLYPLLWPLGHFLFHPLSPTPAVRPRRLLG